MLADLFQRCAAFGWTLRPNDNGWELLGNGAPAIFRSTASLTDWLVHQERSRAHERVGQATMPSPGILIEHQAELL